MKNLLLIFFLIFSFMETFAQNQSAEEIIKMIQMKFNSFENLKADFDQRIIGKSNSNYELKGKFYYKKKSSYRIEITDKILISNENEIFNIDNKKKRVVISPMDETTTNFSIDRIINLYPSKCSLKKIYEDNLTAVELIPNSNSLPFKKVRIFFTNEFLIDKFVISNFSNTQTIIELKNIVLNSNISISYFNFNQKSDFEIIDLR